MKFFSKPHHLLILSQHPEAYQLLIEQENLPDLSITSLGDPNQVIKTGNDFDLVFGEPLLVGKVLDQLPNMKWLQSSWAGVEPLVQPNMRSDYVLTNIRNVYGPMMSEYVFGYLLMIERKILPRWQSQIQAKWDDQPYDTLRGKLLGLLGVGTIGAYLTATAKHFGMRVYGFTRQSESCPQVDKYFHEGSLDEFGEDLDYLVCCLPATAATSRMVDANFLNALPRKAWLINVGRGSAVDESALVNALNAGSLAGAVLDVFIEEPLPHEHPLWHTPNTFITSHTAAKNIPEDIVRVFIDNYLRYISGEPLLYRVDFSLGY